MRGEQEFRNLEKRIAGTLFRQRLILFVGGILSFIAAVLAAAIVLSLLAGITILPVWAKIVLLVAPALALVVILWRLVFSRWFSGSTESMALRIEKKFPDLKGRLIAALQFGRMKDTSGLSEYLMKATLTQAEKEAAGLDFNRVISHYALWRNIRLALVAVVVAVVLLAVFPGLFSYSYQVYSHPTELIAPPLGYRLANFPGDNITAVKYRDIDIGGILTGGNFPDEADIYFRFADGVWQKTGVDLNGQSRVAAQPGDSMTFVTTLKQVRRSFEFYVRAGRITTPVATVEVVDRPRVVGIKQSLFYPKYTGLSPVVVDENEGSLSAVVGTRINMQIETNVAVDVAEMVYADSSRSRFEINGLMAEQSFTVDEDRRYTIHLVDKLGEKNPDPIEYYITAVPDEYPVIDVVRPGMDINLTEEMIIPLLLRIYDDYGFSSLVLKYRVVSERGEGEENVAVLHFSDRIKTEGEINFNWDVEPLELMPSNYIRYYFEVADNDMISGPKVTRSREYIARLPSLEEIIAQTEAEHGQNIRKAEDFLRSHQELSERLKKIARKMEQERTKADQKLSWTHQKELEEILSKEEKIAEKIEETARDMDELIRKMEENRVAGREMLEKLQEIQKLFEEVATPEMKEARLKMLEALKNMDPKKLEEALKDYQMTHEDVMKRLDRTIALLKKMKIEQKVNAMTEMARELVEKQEQVNENTSEAEKEGLPDLKASEEKVKEGLESLKSEAQKLREMLQETKYSKNKEAEEFCSAVEKNEAGESMDQMMDAMAAKMKEQAMEQGQEATSKLLQMLDKMQEGQASMCQGGGGEMAAKLRNAIDDINYLSDQQEELIDRSQMMRGKSEVLRDIAASQKIHQESVKALMRRIDDLGKESPFIAAEMSNIIRSAMIKIDNAISHLSERRGREAVGDQSEALYQLNRAALRMLDALENQRNCDKGGNCNKPTMKLNSLCDRQKQLNEQTQSQCQKPGQQNPGSSVMRRLAAEQGAIRKSLQELQEEFGSSREILGRLDAIADDMKDVSEVLESGPVGQETLDRQLKIYSRMLDATRTMQRKDFTDQRKAAIGEDIIRNSPPALTGNQVQGGLDAEDRLRRFLDEDYPEEYEQQIKAYFKALIERIDGTRQDNE